MTTTEFRIPMPYDPRDSEWWWDHDYGGERKLRISTMEIARLRKRGQGIAEPRHVYFLGCSEISLIKIGSSCDAELRLEVIQRMCPVKLRIIGYIPLGGERLERQLHTCFADRRRHGEWFDVTLSEVDAAFERPIVVRV